MIGGIRDACCIEFFVCGTPLRELKLTSVMSLCCVILLRAVGPKSMGA